MFLSTVCIFVCAIGSSPAQEFPIGFPENGPIPFQDGHHVPINEIPYPPLFGRYGPPELHPDHYPPFVPYFRGLPLPPMIPQYQDPPAIIPQSMEPRPFNYHPYISEQNMHQTNIPRGATSVSQTNMQAPSVNDITSHQNAAPLNVPITNVDNGHNARTPLNHVPNTVPSSKGSNAVPVPNQFPNVDNANNHSHNARTPLNHGPNNVPSSKVLGAVPNQIANVDNVNNHGNNARISQNHVPNNVPSSQGANQNLQQSFVPTAVQPDFQANVPTLYPPGVNTNLQPVVPHHFPPLNPLHPNVPPVRPQLTQGIPPGSIHAQQNLQVPAMSPIKHSNERTWKDFPDDAPYAMAGSPDILSNIPTNQLPDVQRSGNTVIPAQTNTAPNKHSGIITSIPVATSHHPSNISINVQNAVPVAQPVQPYVHVGPIQQKKLYSMHEGKPKKSAMAVSPKAHAAAPSTTSKKDYVKGGAADGLIPKEKINAEKMKKIKLDIKDDETEDKDDEPEDDEEEDEEDEESSFMDKLAKSENQKRKRVIFDDLKDENEQEDKENIREDKEDKEEKDDSDTDSVVVTIKRKSMTTSTDKKKPKPIMMCPCFRKCMPRSTYKVCIESSNRCPCKEKIPRSYKMKKNEYVLYN